MSTERKLHSLRFHKMYADLGTQTVDNSIKHFDLYNITVYVYPPERFNEALSKYALYANVAIEYACSHCENTVYVSPGVIHHPEQLNPSSVVCMRCMAMYDKDKIRGEE